MSTGTGPFGLGMRLFRLAALTLLAGVAEAVVVAFRAHAIADVESWPRLLGVAFGAGCTGALLFLPAILLLELISDATARALARRSRFRLARAAAAAVWGLGALSAAVWVMSWYDRFHLRSLLLPLAVAAVGLVAFAWLGTSARAWLRRGAGAIALAGVVAVVVVDARTAFGQYPTFHIAAQWLALLVASGALRALGPGAVDAAASRESARRLARGLATATACAAVLLPLHWELGPGNGARGMVRGVGWLTLPRTQLFHAAPLNPECEDAAALGDLPPEARAASFLRYANLDPLKRDLAGRNLVLVVMDALRADRLAAYGGTAGLTPNLDALAGRSVVFERAYASSSGTIGTVGALFCMAPPSWTEITTQKIFWKAKLGKECDTMAERLAARGYRTAAFLHYYVAGTLAGGTGYLQGFETSRTGKTDAQVVERALADLKQTHKRKGDRRPAFVWLQLGQAHHPYFPTPPFTPRGPGERARYNAGVQSVDAAMGDLVAGLKRLGLWRRTVLVVMSDHGEEFGEHGGRYHNRALYDETIRVPLLVHDARLEPGVMGEDVTVNDLGAWLLWEWKGAPDPAVVERVSTSGGLLYGALGDVRVSELLSNTGVQAALIRGSRKAIRNLSGKYDELYDRELDPGERRNLVEAAADDDLILDLDRYEALRKCTLRAKIMPLRGKGKPHALAAK